ncbi:M23 family metallopeptidase [Candidatus Nitrotoga sp. M5]|uniref:M23 family metallopeptidase n=1 Tax=Candidatus Nitrotoga sp. M5 TaxID=2890409 RepID=UPI001EF36F21|nr:M23 family metallopeptidase [Candidatus Nitrotoga sp. M5]CAH1385319.1 Murein DD-endopeptidase MepM and murein hydrolase activator NlpD, containing LysM domain [Candidatus Nitrotoga sp. M5]
MLNQSTLTQEKKSKLRWFVALSSLPLLGVVTAFGIAPQPDNSFTSLTMAAEKIVLPYDALTNTSATNSKAATFWRNEHVQRGDTVAELMRRLQVEDPSASKYLHHDPAATSFRQLAVGKSVQAETDMDGSLLTLRYLDNEDKQILIEKGISGLESSIQAPVLETRLLMRTGEINSSLFAATDAINLPESTAIQLAEIFGNDIDFHRDLRKGDKFNVIYEMNYSNGEPVSAGRIQAAEFINQGQSYRVVYFKDNNAHGDYFTPDGKSRRKVFLRSPLVFSRISSGFSRSRFHPVLNKWRSHKGVDYAAAHGTKVKVTADGTVSFVGKKGGYGNVVIVKHKRRHTTLYGHLSRFSSGLRPGQRVEQGDIIGFVGMTGLATGPHLHYEFIVNDQHRDPLRATFPDAAPLNYAQKLAFQDATRSLTARLSLLRDTNLAKLD